jgi:hypothetical protein
MLGIVPEDHKFVLSHQTSGAGGASSDEEGSNDSKHSFMKRLKSFRKSTIRRSLGREKSMSTTGSSPQTNSSLRDKLPAKYIQTTDVKKATLNPFWMEKFRLYVCRNLFKKQRKRFFILVILKEVKRKHFIWIYGIMMMNFLYLKQQENLIKFKVLKDLIDILNKSLNQQEQILMKVHM